jgi:peptide/nickel transport system substrate-binding protein
VPKRLLTLISMLALLVSGVVACTTSAPDATGLETEPAHVQTSGTGTETAPAGAAGGTDVLAFDPVPTRGGTLVIGQTQEPETLYTYGGSTRAASILAASHVLNSIYDGPIESLDYDFQSVILTALPKLENAGSGATLETVAVKPGDRYFDAGTQQVVTATAAVADLPQLRVQFKLKPGVTWDDGTPVTADDSVFSQSLACDPDTDTSKTVCERTSHYARIDDQTVEWQGLPGYTDQTYFTNFYVPLPRHQIGAGGKRMDETSAKDIALDAVFTRQPLSYGPFKVKEWVPGDRIVLTRNASYWRAAEGLPYLDEVVHRFVKDPNALLASLLSGDVDVATQDGLDITQYDALEQARGDGALVPYYVSGAVWEHIDLNLDPLGGHPPLGACKDIRHALAFGTDRQAMVDEIQRGKSSIQHTFVPKAHWAYPDAANLVVYPFDQAQARRLLDDLGFTDANNDGVREAQKDIVCTIDDPGGNPLEQTIPAGTPLELTLNTTAGNDMRQQTTLQFQRNMKDIGVKVNLEYVSREVLFERREDAPLTGRRYDAAEFAWLTGVQPPVDLYVCDMIPTAANEWSGLNNTGWCNPEYDRVGKQAETMLERAEAVPLFAQAQKLFTEDLPVIPLFARVKVMATSPRVMNFKPNATVNSETWNIETWGFSE